MKEAVEERRGRRYKEGDQMVQRKEDFWEFFLRVVGKFFTEEQRVRRDGIEREESWRRGLTLGGRFTLREEASCYPVYRYMGSGARKPVGFLGPVGSLVGRVDHPVWNPGSDEAQTRKG